MANWSFDSIFGEFESREAETGYRREIESGLRRTVKPFYLLLAVTHLVYLAGTYFAVGASLALTPVLLSSALGIASSVLFWLWSDRAVFLERLDRSLIISLLLALTPASILPLIVPQASMLPTAALALLTVAAYVVVPAGLRAKTMAIGLASLLAAVIAWASPQSIAHLTEMASAWLLCANLLGFALARRSGILQRQNYYNTVSERQVLKNLEESHQSIAESKEELREKSRFLQIVLDNINQGVMVYDSDLRLAAWSQGFLNILEIPADWPQIGRTLEDYIRFNAERGEYGDCNVEDLVRTRLAEFSAPSGIRLPRIERSRPNGTVIEVQSNRLPGGGIATTYTDITARKRDEQKIEQLALNCTLTGLANRNLFQRRLQDGIDIAKRLKSVIALLFLDVDKFKAINDTYGHQVGDAIIIEIAERLKECTRDVDTVARIDGDEFSIILTQLQSAELAQVPIHRILDRTAEPIEVNGQTFKINMSIGLSFFPQDAGTLDELTRKADVALHEAKAVGSGAYRLYDEEMDARARELRTMERELEDAVESGQMELHFQPQLDISGQQVIGAEALIRWRHPERGMIPPGVFIPVAESSGIIVAIGDWVLQEACRRALQWQRAGLPPILMAVNISPRQFSSENLITTLMQVLSETGLQPELLELEVTESLMMDDVSVAVKKLQAIAEAGVKLAIDDFGTGYSSLSHLKRFPFHKLKIDQSFVRDLTTDPEDAAITDAIIRLGHSLNLKVIAEGVETQDHVESLRSRGCDELQGYHFAKPMPAAEFEAWYRARLEDGAEQAIAG